MFVRECTFSCSTPLQLPTAGVPTAVMFTDKKLYTTAAKNFSEPISHLILLLPQTIDIWPPSPSPIPDANLLEKRQLPSFALYM